MVAVIIKIRSSHVPGYHCGKGDWTAYGAFSFLFLNPSHSKEWRMKEVMCVCVCVCVCARARMHVCCGGKEPRGLVSCISHLQSMQDDNPGIF